MMFEKCPVEDAIQIATAGAGFTMNAGQRLIDDLMRIATAAAKSNARVTFTGLDGRSTADLMKIAVAGQGAVCFG